MCTTCEESGTLFAGAATTVSAAGAGGESKDREDEMRNAADAATNAALQTNPTVAQLVLATLSGRAGAIAIDVGAVVAFAGLAVGLGLLAGFHGIGLVAIGVIALGASTAWTLITLWREGASVGGRVMQLRRVGVDGLPSVRRATVYDTRLGLDPLQLEPMSRGSLSVAVAPWQIPEARLEGLGLLADDRTWVPLQRPTVIGRIPQALADTDEHLLVGIPDVSRSMSKTHALLEPSRSLFGEAIGILVTDLGSTNGTRIVGPDGRVTKVAPGAPAVLELGHSLDLGDRTFVLAQRGGRSVRREEES